MRMKSKQQQNPIKKRCVIIGAGPAGLGVGWRLMELGHTDFVIYDKNPYVGGLATSFADDAGFTWDIGGHVLHSHYPYFDQMFETVMQGEYFTHKRESWVWIYDRFVGYPFQNNIHSLPERARHECLKGLETKKKTDAHNFKEWLMQVYGAGIAKHFMFPYNRKVWAYPLEKMSYQWVADRVAPVAVKRGTAWGPNAVFHYPKRGGTGDIWRRVASRFLRHIKLEKEVVKIDAQKQQVYFSDGSSDAYDFLFTSMPLDRLLRTVRGVTLPGGALQRSAVTIVGIGIRGNVPDVLRTKCWIYFPQKEVPFFRATVLSNYSKHNAPKGTWSLMTETTSSSSRPLPKGDLAALVIQSAIDMKLVPRKSDIVDVWSTFSAYGYPVPTLQRDSVVDPALQELAKHHIYSRGRFGMWKYEISNQDHTFMQGVEWVNKIVYDA